MSYAKINGKLVEMGNSKGVSGKDIINYAANGQKGRRVTISDPTGYHFTRVEPDKYYDFTDKNKINGKPLEIRSMPERVKGADIYPAGTYFQKRSPSSLALISDQVMNVAGYLFKGQDIIFDEKNGHIMVIPKYILPRGWTPDSTPLMIIFPVEYPDLPPNGFYIQDNVKAPPNHGHIYNRAFNNGFGSNPDEQERLNKLGWVWYCAHVASGSWLPAKIRQVSDWRNGDNLFTFFTLIS